MVKTKFEEVDFAGEFQEFLANNKDVVISDGLANLIMGTDKTELLKVVKSIGSKIVVESVDILNEETFLANF